MSKIAAGADRFGGVMHMNEIPASKSDFIGYEYREITVDASMESIYADGYAYFGWELDDNPRIANGTGSVSMKFKRDRKIKSRAELTRLQRQFDACVSGILGLEKSKRSIAAIAAYSIGLAGTAFMLGAIFAFLGGVMPLFIILALPALVGWIAPYFVHNYAFVKRSARVTLLIESKYDEVYEVCKKADHLR